jgi:phosphate starvation-inducible protein PhoH and related proteins
MARKFSGHHHHHDQARSSAVVVEEVAVSRDYKRFKPMNVAQREYLNSLKRNTFTIGIGPAGTGKTALAIQTALDFVQNKEHPIEQVVFIRAHVEACGESSIGALPGGLDEKLLYLQMPVRDNLRELISPSYIDYLFKQKKIEVLPVGHCRGRSFHNSFIILDEGQNCSTTMIKTVLTRTGTDSKVCISGDPTQSDIRGENGLEDAARRLAGMEDLGVVYFGIEDVVRHSALSEIIRRYNH